MKELLKMLVNVRSCEIAKIVDRMVDKTGSIDEVELNSKLTEIDDEMKALCVKLEVPWEMFIRARNAAYHRDQMTTAS